MDDPGSGGGGSMKSQQSAGKDQPVKHKSAPKVKFTPSEDTLLEKLVAKYGENNWEEIASQIPGRNIRQCHDRWVYYLNPNVKKTPWTEEEENLLFKCVHEIGPHWVRITQFFEGRTDTQIKNKWNVLKRRMEYDKQFKKDKSPKQMQHIASSQSVPQTPPVAKLVLPLLTSPTVPQINVSPIQNPVYHPTPQPPRQHIPPIHVLSQGVQPPPIPSMLPSALFIPANITSASDIPPLIVHQDNHEPKVHVQPEPKFIVRPIPHIEQLSPNDSTISGGLPHVVIPMPPKVMKKLETGSNPFISQSVNSEASN